MNNGQVCIAPDYVFVHKSKKAAFVEATKKYIQKFYTEDASKETSYARIVNGHHHNRVNSYIADAVEKGATIEAGGTSDNTQDYIAPTVVSNLPKDAKLLEQEIFGPVMPILEFTNISEVIDMINSKEKPLALYIYSCLLYTSPSPRDATLSRMPSSA